MSYKGQRTDRYRSRIEGVVAIQLAQYGFDFEYESGKFHYMIPKKYTPDFKVGDVYIEVKGWWPPEERRKLLYVTQKYPDLKLFVSLQTPDRKITKASPTSYAMWCQTHGIAWCPAPPPKEFIEAWLDGRRLTYDARPLTANQQMELL